MTEVRFQDHVNRHRELIWVTSALEGQMFPRQKPPLLVLILTITFLMDSNGFQVQLIATCRSRSHVLETLLMDLAHYRSS